MAQSVRAESDEVPPVSQADVMGFLWLPSNATPSRLGNPGAVYALVKYAQALWICVALWLVVSVMLVVEEEFE